MVVEGKIILELKAVSELNKVFEAELLSYLKATGVKLGVCIAQLRRQEGGIHKE